MGDMRSTHKWGNIEGAATFRSKHEAPKEKTQHFVVTKGQAQSMVFADEAVPNTGCGETTDAHKPKHMTGLHSTGETGDIQPITQHPVPREEPQQTAVHTVTPSRNYT